MTVPTYLLVPVAFHYAPGGALATRDGYEVHPAPPDQRSSVMRFAPPAPRPRSFSPWSDPSTAPKQRHIVFHRDTYCVDRMNYPNARRKLAREGTHGRRGAKRIPLYVRKEVDVFHQEGVPPTLVRSMIEPYAVDVLVVWACPRWRVGAPVRLSNKQTWRRDRSIP